MRIFTSPDRDMAARLLSGCNTPVNVGIWGVSRDHVVPSFNSWVEATLPNLACSGSPPGTWSILSTLLRQLSRLVLAEEKVQISNTNRLVCSEF